MTPTSIYLDNAATSFPKPESVYVATDHYQRTLGAAFARGTHGTEYTANVVERCRHQLAQLTGATDSRSIAFTFNGTDGLNLLLRGFLRPGHHVVTTTLEHNSVLRPLDQLRELLPITIDMISFDPDSGLLDLDALQASLDAHPPELVVMNQVSNVTGIVQPLKEIVRMSHAAGSIVLVDAAQSAGHLPIDVKNENIDLLAASGHKGLLGPLGTGFVYIDPALHSRMTSLRCGGTGTDSESRQQPQTMPQLLESGNLNMPGIIGLNAALDWRQTDDARQRDAARGARFERLMAGLAEIPDVRIYCGGSSGGNAGVVSFNVGESDCRDVAMILSQSFGIQCRAGLHCAPLAHQTLGTAVRGGTIRFSPGLFTTDDEIETALAAVRSVVRSL